MIKRARNLYRLPEHYITYHPALKKVQFDNHWCHISEGSIWIRQGYAWDGCSPKLDIAGLLTIGIPDGRLYNGLPMTYFPSLVHDVFCQFRDEIPVTKEQTLTIFNDMLEEVGFLPRPFYVAAVKHLGPKRFAGDQA